MAKPLLKSGSIHLGLVLRSRFVQLLLKWRPAILATTNRSVKAFGSGDELVLLFWGGTNTRQQSDIEKAKSLYSEYKFRKKELVKKQEQRNQETKSKQTHSPPRRKK